VGALGKAGVGAVKVGVIVIGAVMVDQVRSWTGAQVTMVSSITTAVDDFAKRLWLILSVP
jgi:hypothetical protein